MDLQHRVNIRKAEQFTHQRAGAGIFHLCVLRLSLSVQQNQFPNASTINGTHAAEVENHFAAILQKFSDHPRKSYGLVAINDAALAVNNHDIAIIPGFQTEFQLRLLKRCFKGSQAMRLQPCLLIRMGKLHANR